MDLVSHRVQVYESKQGLGVVIRSYRPRIPLKVRVGVKTKGFVGRRQYLVPGGGGVSGKKKDTKKNFDNYRKNG